MISLCHSCRDITGTRYSLIPKANISRDVTECTRFCWGSQKKKKKMIRKARCQGKDCGRAIQGLALAVFPDTCHVHSELFPQRARKEEEHTAWRSLFGGTTCPDEPLLTRTRFPKSRRVSHLKNVGGFFFFLFFFFCIKRSWISFERAICWVKTARVCSSLKLALG